MTYEVIIIGSGAGGGAVAYNLAKAGINILMLESGRHYDPRTAPWFDMPNKAPLRDYRTPYKHGGYYDAHIIDHEKEPYTVAQGDDFNWGRARMLGGRTNHWGRNVPRYGPDDFKPYTNTGIGKDWPISYEDIEPYYDKVESFIGVNGSSSAYYNSPEPNAQTRQQPPPPRAYEMIFKKACESLGYSVSANPTAILTENKTTESGDTRSACVYATSCKRGCPIDAAFQSPTGFIFPAVETGNLELRTNAAVFKIETDENGAAHKVHYIDKKTNQKHHVEANYIVLAASAMESCRILLNSKSERFPMGLANSSGLVGKNITDSPACGWDIQLPALENLQPHNEDGTSEPHVCLPWWIRGEDQRNEQDAKFFGGYRILPYGGGRKNPPGIHTLDKYLSLKRGIYGAELKRHMRRYYGSVITLATLGAMQPNENCYCEIDTSKTDFWGVPVLKFHWQWSDEDLDRAAHMYRTVKILADKMGGRIINDPSPPDGRKVFSPGGGNNHEIGGAIMGDNADDSVVNSFLQTWDVPNLYITDGACFVNHGDKNPTLTIMALAWRTSEEMIKRINGA